MKITGVECVSLAVAEAVAEAVPAAAVPVARRTDARELDLIRLQTDAGPAGIAVAANEDLPAIEALVRDRLAGADPRAAMGLWERMNAAGANTARFARARASLDIAMWDLKAKANDEPLWKTLGGATPRARAHLAWDRPWDGRRTTEWFRRMRAGTGIRSASVAAGTDAARDLAAMSAVRDALEATVPESMLMVRFDGAACPHDVIRHVRRLERDVDLTCVCSPVRRGDFGGARHISDAVRAAVCIGRGIGEIEAFLPFLQHYAANVIELDIAALGISGSLQMADAAFGFELPVLLTGYPGHVPVHLFPVLPTAMSIEIAYSGSADLAAHGVTFAEGRASAGLQPGNGLTLQSGETA